MLVDDHPVTRLGIRNLLEMTEDLLVVGEAGDEKEAVRLANRLEPDLVILDLRLGETGDGMEVCRRMKDLPNPPHVLIHSAYKGTEDMATAAVAGADGYFHKGAEYLEFAGVVRRVLAGERVWFVHAEAAESLDAEEKTRGPALTPREREVFALMLRRYSNEEVGRALYLSIPTVKTHVKHILAKMGLKSRKDLFRPSRTASSKKVAARG